MINYYNLDYVTYGPTSSVPGEAVGYEGQE